MHFATVEAAIAAQAQVQAISSALPPCGAGAGNVISTTAIDLPQIGLSSEVEVGRSMVSSVRAQVRSAGLTLRSTITLKGKHAFEGYTLTIPPQSLAESSGGAFTVTDYTYKFDMESKPRNGIARPDLKIETDLTSGQVKDAVLNFGFNTARLPITGAEATTGSCMSFSENAFRRELLYSGVAKGVVEIEYREFVNDLARPAFSQSLHYDLGEGDEIGFKGARIKIVKATNSSVTYVVRRGLTPEG